MRITLKFIVALAAAFIAMLAFRALVFTIYTVPGSLLEPEFKAGDRVMVNRWSYGLRTGGSGLFPYGRLWRQPITKDDLVEMVRRGRGVCGTAWTEGRTVIVPGKLNCARHDYYSIDQLGLVREEQIIGRVSLVIYNHAPGHAFWRGYSSKRILLPR